MKNVNTRAWFGLIFLSIMMWTLIFVSAGTLNYWQGWVYLVVFFGASFLITLYLIKKNPVLLEHRLRAGPIAEKEIVQKIIMFITSLEFIIFLIVPALDYRFGWSKIPLPITMLGNLLVVVGFYIIFLVYKENPFSSATIEVTENQKVITTGPYALIRHPMYFGSLLLCIGTPLALGSYWGLLVLLGMLPFLIWRLLDEEQFLAKNLAGYREYQMKVPWRLIPGIF